MRPVKIDLSLSLFVDVRSGMTMEWCHDVTMPEHPQTSASAHTISCITKTGH